MGYTPFAHYQNFTVENVRDVLELFPVLYEPRRRTEVIEELNRKLSCYGSTAYQFACQSGLEARTEYFTSRDYLRYFDDEGLKQYLSFWFKMYVCPNPYIVSNEDPICPFKEIAERILNNDDHRISFEEFWLEKFGDGGSKDIFKNALMQWGSPILVNGDEVSVAPDKVTELEVCLTKVQETLPMDDNKSIEEFFERFNETAFLSFHDSKSIVDFFSKQKIVSDLIEIEPISTDLSIDELGSIISRMIDSGDNTDTAVRMFGLKYAKCLIENNYDNRDIVSSAGLAATYKKRIKEGKDIYESILRNRHGVMFFNDTISRDESTLRFDSQLPLDAKMPHNLIVFGAPGTGKSRALDDKLDELKVKFHGQVEYERVTFHSDYSYASFVGTYKPVMVRDDDSTITDEEVTDVLAILNNEALSAQDKYEELYKKHSKKMITRLPVLVGLYTDEDFCAKDSKGVSSPENYLNDKKVGRDLRKFIKLCNDNAEAKDDISYEYVPGPFMRLYTKALINAQTDKPIPHVLIIEEINRANAAAVFGDVFQLLDRNKETNISEYSIVASEDIKRYLSRVDGLGGNPEMYKQIKIPDNMLIWATMNSADQGVFPLDTAFKRRWDFEYLGIDKNENAAPGEFYIENAHQRIEWNAFRKAINELLSSNNVRVHEDKLLGPFFVNTNRYLKDGSETELVDDFYKVIENKVLMYLFEDAAKTRRQNVFVGEANTNRFSKLCEVFESEGIGIFASIDGKDFSTVYRSYVHDATSISDINEQDLSASEDNNV